MEDVDWFEINRGQGGKFYELHISEQVQCFVEGHLETLPLRGHCRAQIICKMTVPATTF